MSETKYKEILMGSDVVYIDPVDCGSTVGYRIKISGTEQMVAGADVELSDCNRTINWSFYGKTPLKKIDAAIEALTKFRNSYAVVLKKYAKKETK